MNRESFLNVFLSFHNLLNVFDSESMLRFSFRDLPYLSLMLCRSLRLFIRIFNRSPLISFAHKNTGEKEENTPKTNRFTYNEQFTTLKKKTIIFLETNAEREPHSVKLWNLIRVEVKELSLLKLQRKNSFSKQSN